MGIEKITKLGVDAASGAIEKAQPKTHAALCPAECGEKLQNTLQGLAASNSGLVKKYPFAKLIDKTTELLEGYSQKPLNDDLSNLEPKNMVLVHVSDFLPKDGKIECARSFSKQPNGLLKPRSTVHFSINNISPMLYGDPNWSDKQYAFLLPCDKVFEQTPSNKLLGGLTDDFMISGDVEIPKGSIFIKRNPAIRQGYYKISPSTDIEGITVVESSNPDMSQSVRELLRKTGYTVLEQDIHTLDRMKPWHDFCNKYNLTVNAHNASPWGRAEALIDFIRNSGIENNSWLYQPDRNTYDKLFRQFDFLGDYFEKNGDEICFNYKKCFLSAIEQIKKEIPEEKISYDINRLKKILEDAKTPLDAAEKIEKELNLTPMIPYEDAQGIPSFFNFAQVLDGLQLTKQHLDLARKNFIILD